MMTVKYFNAGQSPSSMHSPDTAEFVPTIPIVLCQPPYPIMPGA